MAPLVVREVRDREQWNALIRGLPNYDLRQSYEWGEVRASQGWRPWRLAAFEGDSCVAAVSLMAKTLPVLGWSALYASGGPLLADTDNQRVWREVLEAIRAVAGKTRAVFLRVSPKVSDQETALREALVAHGFQHLPEDWTTWNSPRICMTMDLREPEEVLSHKVRKRYREHIRSAPKHGLTVRQAVSLDESWEFHRTLLAVGRRKGLPVRGRDYFERLWKEYLRPGRGVLLVADHQGQAVGGLLGVKLGEKAYMLYVTLRDRGAGQKLQPGPLLYWEFIRWAKQAGCRSIDWGGIGTNYPPREEDPGFGLYHFKLGFNSSLEYLTGYYDLVFSPALYRAFRFLERRLFASAWMARAQLNGRVAQARSLVREVRRKIRHYRTSVAHRGFWMTVYWGAYGFLKPNRFVVMARDLSTGVMGTASGEATTFEIWEADRLRQWRRNGQKLPTEFFQDEIDDVDACAVVTLGGDVAGLIWIYRADDSSRLFQLREWEAELNNGYVLLPHRGQGLFRRLLQFACQYLEEQGCQTVYAMVHSANTPSLRAFRGADFRDVGRILHFLVFRPKFRGERRRTPATEGEGRLSA